MPAYVRDGGSWKETTPFSRLSSAWSESTDELYVRDEAQWKLIHPDPASVGDLLPVENLAVTSGPTHFSVTIGWTNPTQPTITPTQVQVRLAELGAVWTEYDYPTTEATWGALDASTTYVAQVRLIERVNGIITNTSVTRHVEFTTDAAPVGAPAEDPGSPGGTSTTFPLGGSTGGTPSAPSTPDGCWWEWKLQILDQDTTTINWQDTGITGTADGDAADITYDTAALDNTRTYRMCMREACDTDSDTVADEFGEWQCSEPFPGEFDWGATCGLIPLSPTSGLAAAADAVWAFPRYCNVADSGIDMVDAISNTQISKGASFAALYATADGEWGVVANSDGGITMTAGLAAIPLAIAVGQDFTIGVRRRLSPGHTFSLGRTTTLASIGQGAVVVQAVETATGWYPRVQFRLESGFVTLDGSANEDTTVGSVANVMLQWVHDGDKSLWFGSTEVDVDTSGSDLDDAVTVQPMYWTSEVPFGSSMQQLGWDRALTDEEIGSFGTDCLFGDDFNRANADPLDGDWNNVGAWELVSNTAQLTGTSASPIVYHDTAMASDDHFVVGTITPGTFSDGRGTAILARHTLAGGFYGLMISGSGGTNVLNLVRGTDIASPTVLDTHDLSGATTAQTVRLEVEGAAIRGFLWNGTSWDLVLGVIDETYATGTRVGFSAFRFTGTAIVEDWCAGVQFTDAPNLWDGGSTEIISGGYKHHIISATDQLRQIAGGPTLMDYVVVAGGGGGGGSVGGGGGGGEVLVGSTTVDEDQTVTIGAGGVGGNTATTATNGGNTSLGSLVVATGGGRGAGWHGSQYAANGGGNGGGGDHVNQTGGTGEQFDGGDGPAALGSAAGGGGASEAGTAGLSGINQAAPGVGGDGIYSAWVDALGYGDNGYFGGGGGGGNYATAFNGADGGLGGGGRGGSRIKAAAAWGQDGTPNTGGGGGGGGNGDNGAGSSAQAGDGGSGIVIVRYEV